MPKPRSIRKREYRLADLSQPADPTSNRTQQRARRRADKKAATRARKAAK